VRNCISGGAAAAVDEGRLADRPTDRRLDCGGALDVVADDDDDHDDILNHSLPA